MCWTKANTRSRDFVRLTTLLNCCIIYKLRKELSWHKVNQKLNEQEQCEQFAKHVVSNMAKFKAHHPRSVKATARRVLKKRK